MVDFAGLQICPVPGVPGWHWITLCLQPSEVRNDPGPTLSMCFPHCIPLVLDPHSREAESSCSHPCPITPCKQECLSAAWGWLISQTSFILCSVQLGYCCVLRKLPQQKCHWGSQGPDTLGLVSTGFCCGVPHCLRLSCMCYGHKAAQQQVEPNSHLKCCRR